MLIPSTIIGDQVDILQLKFPCGQEDIMHDTQASDNIFLNQKTAG